MLEQIDLSLFSRLVRDRSGLALHGSRLEDLERAIGRTLAATGLEDPAALYRLLRDPDAGGPALRILVSAITIGETHFFRHRPQMEALERRVLPDLIGRRREDRRLRIWSAGCSTGEETYSLAILLRRALPDIADWDVTVLGSDIDVEALEKARRGAYGPWSFREVPPDLESRYFVRTGRDRQILRTIREMVTFEYLNLAEDVYPSLLNGTLAVDLIVCRNVLIYFDRPTIDRVVTGFHRALTDGGWLVVGPAEPSQDTFRLFDVHNLPGTTAYQKPLGDDRGRAPFRAPDVVASPPARLVPDGPPKSAGEERSVAPAMPPDEEGDADTATAEAAYSTARLYANRLELDLALQWVETAIARAPLFAAAHHLHALVLQEQEQRDRALDALRRCIYADPDFVMGHFAMAGLLETFGRRQRALRSLDVAAGLLHSRDDADPVEGGDGMTAGRLRRLVEQRRELWT